MIPKAVTKAVEWLGKKVAQVTGELRDHTTRAWTRAPKPPRRRGYRRRLWRRSSHTKKKRQEDAAKASEAKLAKGNESKALQSYGEGCRGCGEGCQGCEEGSAEAVQGLVDWVDGSHAQERRIPEGVPRSSRPSRRRTTASWTRCSTSTDAMRKVLGPFNDELEHQWRMTEAPESCACGPTERDRETRGRQLRNWRKRALAEAKERDRETRGRSGRN